MRMWWGCQRPQGAMAEGHWSLGRQWGNWLMFLGLVTRMQRNTAQDTSVTRLVERAQFSTVAQSCPTLCDPWTAAHQASLSITNSQSLLKLMSIGLVMPSNHLILCHPLLLLPSIFPNIRVFSNESVLHIRWPKDWSFSFSPSNEQSGLISFRMD